MIGRWRRKKIARAHEAALEDEDRARAQALLKRNGERIVDLETRLVRLEAEVGIYRPLFTNDEEGSQ